MDQHQSPSERDVQLYAAHMMNDDIFKEIVRRIKNDIIRRWANELSAAKREELYWAIQGVGSFESTVRALAEAKVMHDRKEAAAKAAEERALAGLTRGLRK